MKHLQYPIGVFERAEHYTAIDRQGYIQVIQNLAPTLRDLIATFTPEQFEKPYREGGWNAKQVIHHLADSHMNSYIRFKLALTEDNPTIKPYREELWAEMQEYQDTPIAVSLNLLEALHIRWTNLLNTMQASDFERTFFHPESKKSIHLAEALALYAWHSRHHAGHIELIKNL